MPGFSANPALLKFKWAFPLHYSFIMVVMFVLTVYQHRIQRVSNAGIMIWVPKGAKIFIAIGSKHRKKFSVTIPSCFFLKKQSLLFKCYVSTRFYFQFLTGSSVRFVHYYWFYLNIFRLEDINPKKHSSVFNRLSERKCKNFSTRPCPCNQSS